jgi:hypothetical protein
VVQEIEPSSNKSRVQLRTLMIQKYSDVHDDVIWVKLDAIK